MGAARRFFRTTVVRLSAIYIVLFAVSVTLLLSGVYGLTLRVIDRETDGVIQAELRGLSELYSSLGLRGLADVIRDRSQRTSRTRSVYLLVDGRARPVAGNLDAWPRMTRESNNWFEFDMQVRAGERVENHPVRAALILLPGGYRLLVGTDVVERTRFERIMGRVGAWSVVLVILVGSALAVWMNRRLLRQVNSIAAAGQQIANGDFGRRLPVAGTGDELDELAVGLNTLLDRIEQLTMALRFVIDGTAHDLRGPLSRLRTRVERAMAGSERSPEVLESISAEIETVQRTLDSLLRIAQAQSGESGTEFVPVSLGTLAGEMVELYAPVAAERGVELVHDAIGDGVVHGSRQLLAHAVANLIDNALKYTPKGGRVRVSVRGQAGRLELEVADSGPGIPAADRQRVLGRFVRLDSAQAEPGSGLGLSLVAAVCRLHHADMALEDAEPGLRVLLRFPQVSGTAQYGQK